MKTVTLEVHSLSNVMADFVQPWKSGKATRSTSPTVSPEESLYG